MREGKEMTSVTKKAIEDLKKRGASAHHLEKEKNKAEKSAKLAEKTVKKLAAEHKNVEQQNKELAAKTAALEEATAASASAQVETCTFLCVFCELLDENRLTHFSALQLQPQCPPPNSPFQPKPRAPGQEKGKDRES